MAEVIDALFFELGFTGDIDKQADKIIAKVEELDATFEELEKKQKKLNVTTKTNGKGVDDNVKLLAKQEAQTKKNVKTAENLLQAVGGFTKALGALATIIVGGIGLDKLANETARANLELDNSSKNIGMSANSLSVWKSAAELAGGSAEGMAGYLSSLSSGINRLVVMGDTSLIPFFNAFGVSVIDGAGKTRDLNAILLDLSDSMSRMDRVQAHTIAQSMGMDEGTFNLLIQGRKAVEGYLSKTSQIYKSNAQDLETSRKLTAATAYLNQQFDGLKLMIGNAFTPVLLKVVETTTKFFEFLQRNENLVKGVFTGIAGAISVALLPMLLSAAGAVISFMAPFLPLILIVGALGLAFGLLYDDYAKWADGAKSLFDWAALIKWIKEADFSVDNLKKGFARLITGYNDWGQALEAGKKWLELKGFTKDGEMTLDTLINGFKNLTSELINAVLPTLQKVGGTISKLLDGDFKGAWEDTKDLAEDGFNYAVDQGKQAFNKVVEFFDVATGHDPDNGDSSLTQVVKSGSIYNKSTLGAPQEMLARAISHGEGNYNSVNRGLINKKNLGSYEEDLSKLTINEILSRNNLSANDPRRMNAVGRYQIINSTLRGKVKELGLSGNELFTPEMQDKLFLSLIPDVAKSYMEGKHNDKNAAMTAIAKTWASVGVPIDMQGANGWVRAGESFYAGDGGNKSNPQSLALVSEALDSVRSGKNVLDQPLVSYGVVEAARGAQSTLNNMQNIAQGQNTVNNSKTEVALNGDIIVNSSSSTISGTIGDAASSFKDRFAALNRYNYGVN